MGKMYSLFSQGKQEMEELAQTDELVNHIAMLPLRYKIVFFLTLEHVNVLMERFPSYEADLDYIDGLSRLIDLVCEKAKDDDLSVAADDLVICFRKMLSGSMERLANAMKMYDEADEETLDDDTHISSFVEILSVGCMYHAIHLILSRIAPMQEKEIKAMLTGRRVKDHTMSFAKIKKMAVEINKELVDVLNHTFDELKNED